jgi:putative DNA methylase
MLWKAGKTFIGRWSENLYFSWRGPSRGVWVSERKFIESPRFPVKEVSRASAAEKGPGRPPHWEMVFWWTRKPLIAARAVIAGCLLPENTDRESFLRSIGIRGKGIAYRNAPSYKFDGVKLLDPFAGFGSIPLEALRLGISATAVELLPAAYVFLKAILEHPKYGKKLSDDVRRWGEWVVERLKDEVKELYDEDVAVYIGSWEVKCPNCGRWTPLVGNWWLARVKGSKGYERIAWMKPVVNGDRVGIEVVDLNKMFGDRAVERAKIVKNRVIIDSEEFRVPESNIEARREQAVCLLCNQPIKYYDAEDGRHVIKPGKGEKLKWYVKYALSRYNEGDDSLARQRLLVKVKVKQGDLEFEPCTEKDQEKLEKAREEVKKLLEANDPDVPRDFISPYSVRYLFPILYGMTEWYKLFNPRQLLTLVKLVKLIREAGKRIEQEKVKEGLSKEEAFKYAEAIVTYLAIVLVRYVDYNSLGTVWNYGGQLPAQVAHTLSMRGIAMMWNWGDVSPFARMSGTGTLLSNLDKTIDKMLPYLIFALNSYRDNKVLLTDTNVLGGELTETVKVLLDDATILNKVDAEEKFDLIVTDPPYYDDVPYTELSDFYYVWLKRALSDVIDNKLAPRFIPEAFFEKVGESYIEIPTQWEKYALSEVSLNPPRLGPNAKKEEGIKHFQNLLNLSFNNMASRLKEDGILVTFYAHTSPDAWKALLEAGWENSGLRITNAFPLVTESERSIVKRGKLSMDTSIIVVWRKGSEGSVDASDLYEEMADASARRARELIDLGISGRDLIIGTLAEALSVATKYKEVRSMGRVDVRTLVDSYIYPASLLGLARALAYKADLKETIKSPEAMFYLIVKFALSGMKEKVIESTDARIFSIGTSLDLGRAKKLRILKGGESEGAKVARAQSLILMEPTSTEKAKLEELLEVRGVGVREPEIRCSIDALHVLEYYSVSLACGEFKKKLDELRSKYPSQVEEAILMAKMMAKVLSKDDKERVLCERIVGCLEPVPRAVPLDLG